MTAVLQMTEVKAAYRNTVVLHGVTFAAEAGTCLALVGRNGAGKTSALRAAFGLMTMGGGRVALRGTDVTGWPTHKIARAGMALVPQGRGIVPGLTTMENLDLAVNAGRSGRWDRRSVLELFPRLKERASVPATALSGGEQQLLAIARALVLNPECVLLDEPTEGLAPLAVDALREPIRRMRDDGVAVVLAEQNLTFARSLADRFSVIEKGAVVADLAGDDADVATLEKFMSLDPTEASEPLPPTRSAERP
ncbi:ABC transporter ATP-binding protein [Nocardioides sp.]|uniref:ABC transporter ATP-binding protein n=1 Tax=Nocardioides sp. TaxID=35761 RepID=UPI00263046BE|nr:ABC transporter ATP-binding protein [Nocardioides sp.]MDI6912498.1 ABC transporter ATP-binding protein [Nocardioides sp.]